MDKPRRLIGLESYVCIEDRHLSPAAHHSINSFAHVASRDEPSHLGGGRELAIDEALDLGLGPPVVDVHDGEHEPLPGLELVLDAVLVALALHFHGGQHQTVADEVGRIADALCSLEAKKCKIKF